MSGFVLASAVDLVVSCVGISLSALITCCTLCEKYKKIQDHSENNQKEEVEKLIRVLEPRFTAEILFIWC